MPQFHDENYLLPYLQRIATAESLLFTNGRQKESLSGEWHYCPDLYDTCLRSKWYKQDDFDSKNIKRPFDFDWTAWPTMNLPAVWNMHDPKLFYYESSIVFTRQFKDPQKHGGNTFLRFGGVQYRTYVFINGSYIGYHDGGSTPFNFNISEYLKSENRIVIVVENNRRKDRVPMHNTDWFNYGGIYRDVELIRVPSTYITNFAIALVPDGTYSRIHSTISISGHASSAYLEIPELEIKKEVRIEKGHGEITLDAEPELWSPESPKLYSVIISCEHDTVQDYIGFRQIWCRGNRLELNGKPLFLRGVSLHEESVENGRAVSEAEIRENIRLAKELNCNYLRLAHYPHSELVSRIADEEGMMLWEEIPVYWAINFSNPQTYADAENQLCELIRRDYNRASVIIWSVGNENPDTDDRYTFMKKLVETVHEKDFSRPVSAACLVDRSMLRIADRLAHDLDIIGINEYYGWYNPEFEELQTIFENSQPTKPVIISEFGGAAVSGNHGTRTERFTEENQEYIYNEQVKILQKIDYIAGTSPWVLFDFRSPRRNNGFQLGYNRKGLMDELKKSKKAAFFVMQRFYARVIEQENRANKDNLLSGP